MSAVLDPIRGEEGISPHRGGRLPPSAPEKLTVRVVPQHTRKPSSRPETGRGDATLLWGEARRHLALVSSTYTPRSGAATRNDVLQICHFPRNASRRHYERGCRVKQSQFACGPAGAPASLGPGVRNKAKSGQSGGRGPLVQTKPIWTVQQ